MSSTPPTRAARLAVLGLELDATTAQITQAYRDLARLTHPDTAPGRQDTARFIAASDAYHALVADIDEPAAGPKLENTRHCHPPLAPTPWLRTASVGRSPEIVAGPVRITAPGQASAARQR